MLQWLVQNFPVGRGGATPEVGAPTCYLAKVLTKTENERNWTEREMRVPSTSRLGHALADELAGPGPNVFNFLKF